MFDDKDFVWTLFLALVICGLVTCAALFPDSDNNQSIESCQAQHYTQAQLNSVQSQLNSVQAQLAGIENEIGKK